MYDIVVIGGGPAGMTAALYGCRNGKSVLIIERDNFGGQMTNSPKLENYPGYSQISGNELAEKMLTPEELEEYMNREAEEEAK